MSSDAHRRPGVRKMVAQAGVVLFVLQMLGALYAPYLQYLAGQWSFPLFFGIQMGVWLLLLAALLPQRKDEEWGSIWPLSGYDNAIDAIYVRGPWWVRFEELDEQEKQQAITDGMSTTFGST